MAGFPNILLTRNAGINIPGPSGIASIDANNIQSGINQALSNYNSGVGTNGVNLGGASNTNPYIVNSFGRYDTVTFVSGTTWTDTSTTAADVIRAAAGNYFLICPGAPNQRTFRITSVTPGTGFTTDVPPNGTSPSGVTALLTQPGIVIPSGRVNFYGMGGLSANITGMFPAGSSNFGSGIIDTGTGVAVLVRGSDTLGTQGKIRDMVIWGGAGVAGTALVGLYVGNSSWFLDVEDVDTSWFAQAGVGIDGNMNTLTFRRCSAANIASAGTTLVTGGYLIGFTNVVTSAAVRLESCIVSNLFGMGVGAFFSGNIGALATKLVDCQVYDINAATSSPEHSAGVDGVALVLQGGPSGECQIDHCWTGTNIVGDLYVQTANVSALDSVFSSNTMASPVRSFGNLSLRNAGFSAGGSITACVNLASGTLSWDNCNTNGHPLTSVITAAQALGTGTTTGMYPGAAAVGTAIGNQIFQGSGVPNNAQGANGDFYFRSDTPGTANQRLYIKSAGAWTALTL